MTWIDIIDTAVKIALGAAITGIASYFIARMNQQKELEREKLRQSGELEKEKFKHSGEMDKEKLKYLIQLFESIAAKVEDFNRAILDYSYSCPVKGDPSSLEDAFLADRIAANQKLSPQEAEKLNEKRDLARKKNEEIISARTLLGLLGANDAQAALNRYKRVAEVFWLESIKDNFDVQKYAKLMQEMGQYRKELDDALRDLYPLKLEMPESPAPPDNSLNRSAG
jgi:hypothetical protein